MLKIGQNWGKIANYPPPPNAQKRSAPLCESQNYLFFRLNNELILDLGKEAFDFLFTNFTSILLL